MNKKLGELIWLAVSAGIAMALVLLLTSERFSPLILAPIGGSAVYLFALTDSDESQPRALFGGHLGSTVIGILCFWLFGDAIWVSVIAVVAAMAFMMITRTIHPSAGANPLIMVHHHAGIFSLVQPVGVGVITLILVAILWSRVRPGKQYTNKW